MPRKPAAALLREALHDQAGPALFSLAAQLRALELDEKLPLSARRRVQSISAGVEALRQDLRRLLRGAPEAPALDLPAALEGLARSVNGVFQNRLRRPITNAVVTESLYRIAREAVHNALRHARARRIIITLAPGLLSVQNDGRAPVSGAAPGLGMKLMERRARRLRGRVTLQHVGPRATVLACHFPLSAK
ncbi:MAG TPA: histidine kinase [Verrucomicrobiae bacterium]|jgi:signal transduction histidine kinase|nr:histidine kinase [Verrucomicrobiae bacterium]